MFLPSQMPSSLTFWRGHSRSSAPSGCTLAIICKKINDLSIYRRNISNLDVIENKPVIAFVRRRERKYAGGENEGFSHYVIENIGGEIAVVGYPLDSGNHNI
jgi:hypothetical protein